MRLSEFTTNEDLLGDLKSFGDMIEPEMKKFADKIEPHMKKGTKQLKKKFDREFRNKNEPKKPRKDNMLTTDVIEETPKQITPGYPSKQLPDEWFNQEDGTSTPTVAGYRQTRDKKTGEYTDHLKHHATKTRKTYRKDGTVDNEHMQYKMGDKSMARSRFYPNNK